MNQQQVAAISRTQRELSEQFEVLGLDVPGERAERLVRWLQRNGWRVHPELVDRPGPRPTPGPSEFAQAELAKARGVLEGKRGRRPELEVDR